MRVVPLLAARVLQQHRAREPGAGEVRVLHLPESGKAAQLAAVRARPGLAQERGAAHGRVSLPGRGGARQAVRAAQEVARPERRAARAQGLLAHAEGQDQDR